MSIGGTLPTCAPREYGTSKSSWPPARREAEEDWGILTALHPIKPTSRPCPPHGSLTPADGSTYRRGSRVNVWIPSKDTGVDLLVSNSNNKMTLSLQVKFSRDYLATHMKDAVLHKEWRAYGWWTPTRQQIEKSRADYWIFVLVGFANRSTDFIIIKPDDLLKRLDSIHGKAAKKFQSYLWVTQKAMCWETRGLKRPDQLLIAEKAFKNKDRDFTAYLNNWAPIKVLND
jgi:hypothetical protein